MKNELIQTAIAMWQEHGYHNVSINQICKNCGVTKGSFYYHFINKESVILEYYYQSINGLTLDIDGSLSYTEQIYQLIKESTEPISRLNTDIILVLLTSPQIKEASNYTQSSFNDTYLARQMVECCRKGQLSGEIRDNIDAEKLIDTLLITMTGNIYRWIMDNKSFDLLKKDREELEIIIKK